LIISGVISIIIRETFIESGSEWNSSVVWVSDWWVSNILWDSSDHHGDGDIVVVRSVLLLISISFSNGVEGVITNNLSERFEGNRLDVIKIVGWANVNGNWFDLINWDIEVLGPFLPFGGILSFSGEEVSASWGRFWSDWFSNFNSVHHGNTDVFSFSWLLRVLLVVFFVVLLVMFVRLLHEIKVVSFFKVSLLTLITI
jgi:hypothetical protein